MWQQRVDRRREGQIKRINPCDVPVRCMMMETMHVYHRARDHMLCEWVPPQAKLGSVLCMVLHGRFLTACMLQ